MAPAKRITLPRFVPDVVAGDSGPLKLTAWKQKAIQIAVTLEKRGYVTRQDFKHFKIDMSRWRQGQWLVLNPGTDHWVAGPRLPDFRGQHPTNYSQFEASYEDWRFDRQQAA